MSNKNIDFSIFEKNNSTYVQMIKKTALGNSEKTILLQDFLKFVTDFNIDKTVSDTGFIIPSLVRKVVKGTREICFYSIPEFSVNPYADSSNISSPQSLLTTILGSETPEKPFYLKIERSNRPHRGEDRHYNKIEFTKLVIKNIILVTYYDTANEGSIISYNIFHSLNPNSIFQENSGEISDETLLFPSLMPNHYSDKICWGSTGFENRLREYFRLGDHNGIKSIPYVYYSSFFNDDLITSDYGSPYQYQISKDLFNKIALYYKNNFANNSVSLDEVTSALRSSIVSNEGRSRYDLYTTVVSLFIILGPIFSDSEIYSQYFSELKTLRDSNSGSDSRPRIHTISSYLQSRFS